MKKIELLSREPLSLLAPASVVDALPTFDAGAAFTEYLKAEDSAYERAPLGSVFDLIRGSINPRTSGRETLDFEYVDLREVDEIFGQILMLRKVKGADVGSLKYRFQKWDILFAKIMPSLANKKVALVTQDVTNAIASTEFLVLRLKRDVDVNLFYLFRSLRADYFTEQAAANVTGATGRQRINPDRLLELSILLAPRELQERIGASVEKEFSLRTLAMEQAKAADDEAASVLGPSTMRAVGATRRVSMRSGRPA